MDMFTNDFRFFVNNQRKGKITIGGCILTFLVLGICFVYLVVLLNDLYTGQINPRILT